jgi:L-fuculose-phosphate aldolase
MSTAEIIDQLMGAGQQAVNRGLVLASGGNLSARVAGSDEFVVTASGTWLDRLTPDDFAVVGVDGALRGGHSTPSIEWKLHQRTYQVRDDVNAVVHVHPQNAVLIDALGHPIRLITLDHAYYLRKVARVPYFPSGSQEIADAAAEAAREHNAVVLGFHGCSTLGDSVDMALRRALNLEEAALATFRALQLGNTELTFPPEWFQRLAAV